MPPDVTAQVVAAELAAFPDAVVTDVASVKAVPLAQLRELGADISRYLGSHPMAGRERSGALAGSGDLFVGRPWVIAGHDEISYERGSLVDDLILDLGAVPIESTPDEHETWRQRVIEGGGSPTPVIDRFYFKSIYFREPSGVLFEIATLGPGFTTDEPLEHLGERLSLPPDFEHLREQVEPVLTPLPNPRESWAKR